MSLVSKLDNDTYEAVKDCVCPYCAAKLPSMLCSGSVPSLHRWVHAIPGTESRFDCLATKLRNARYDPADEPKDSENA